MRPSINAYSFPILNNLSYFGPGLFLVICLLLLGLPPNSFSSLVHLFAREGGIFETLTFFFLLLISLLFFNSFWKSKQKRALKLALSAVFFCASMEEISWGQFLFQFPTPEVFKKYNYQQEFNFHNLIPYQIFNGILFQGIYLVGILLPLLKKGPIGLLPPASAHFLFIFSSTLQIYDSPLYGGLEKIEVFECFFFLVLFLMVHKKSHLPFSLLCFFSFFFFWANNHIWETRIYEIREFFISFGILLWTHHYLKERNQKSIGAVTASGS